MEYQPSYSINTVKQPLLCCLLLQIEHNKYDSHYYSLVYTHCDRPAILKAAERERRQKETRDGSLEGCPLSPLICS